MVAEFLEKNQYSTWQSSYIGNILILGALHGGLRLILPLVDDLEEAHIKGSRFLFDTQGSNFWGAYDIWVGNLGEVAWGCRLEVLRI